MQMKLWVFRFILFLSLILVDYIQEETVQREYNLIREGMVVKKKLKLASASTIQFANIKKSV